MNFVFNLVQYVLAHHCSNRRKSNDVGREDDWRQYLRVLCKNYGPLKIDAFEADQAYLEDKLTDVVTLEHKDHEGNLAVRLAVLDYFEKDGQVPQA